MQITKIKKPKTQAAPISVAGVTIPAPVQEMEFKKPETMNETRLRRLKELKHLMENHDKIFPQTLRFDLGTWWEGTRPDSFADRNYDQMTSEESLTCGYAACALGSAACYKPFIEEGLALTGYAQVPYYEGNAAFEAGESFFGITEQESYYLFDPCMYPNNNDDPITADQVARRVQELIEKYSK